MNVLITGAGRGIGRAMALEFGRQGHRVLVNYRSRREEAEGTLRALRDLGAEAGLAAGDVADPAQARKLAEDAAEKWGTLDVLVNNAGVTRDRTILKMTEAEWREVVDVNLSGAFWCLQAAARIMSRQKDGAILNVASLLAFRGGVGVANYAASKAGLIGLTRAAARELGRFNIRVNALLPGFHLTDMNRETLGPRVEKIKEEHVLGRLPDLNELARFAASLSGLKSVSGQVFTFDSRMA